MTTFALETATVAIAGRTLLRDLAFELRAGDRLAITGPSGSGKTQLLRALVGLDDLESGAVELNGAAPGDSGYPAYRRQVHLVPTLTPMLAGTVRENLQFALDLLPHKPPPEEAAKAIAVAHEHLRQLGLGAVLDQDTATLSTGEQRRVAIARGLLIDPVVLIADEPTNGLDAKAARAVTDLLVAWVDARSDERLLIFVVHDADVVAALGTKTLDLSAFQPGFSTRGNDG